MNTLNFSLPAGQRPAWRSSAEIEAAALEHEKRRFQGLDGGLPKAQATASPEPPAGAVALFERTLQLLTALIG